MQTFTSSYARKGCRVPDATPTRAIRRHLGRVHVNTSLADVLAEVEAEIAQRIANGDEGWTPELVRATLRYTRWQHGENRAEYAVVMGASL